MKLAQVESQLSLARERFDGEVNALSEMVRDQMVIPICRKHKLDFRAGLGTFAFFNQDGYNLYEDDKRIKSVMRFLDLEINNTFLLGEYVRNVDWEKL